MFNILTMTPSPWEERKDRLDDIKSGKGGRETERGRDDMESRVRESEEMNELEGKKMA